MAYIKDREWKQRSAYHTDHGFVLSTGNMKMGDVTSFSIPPGLTCAYDVPCFPDCYAAKMCKIYPSVRRSWENNYKLLNGSCWGDLFVDDIVKAIKKLDTKLFRWHVGGDIFSKAYLDNMCLIAKKCPDVQFWAFTKQFKILSEYVGEIPKNLTIILSIWPPHIPSEDLMDKYGCCYFQDDDETYDVPVDAYVCQGDCEECQVCTYLVPGESVVIYKH